MKNEYEFQTKSNYDVQPKKNPNNSINSAENFFVYFCNVETETKEKKEKRNGKAYDSQKNMQQEIYVFGKIIKSGK